VCLRKLTVGS